jgi:hypothetical protein
MDPERMPEPWHSFLAEIDRAMTGEISLHCIGGFAVSLHYGLTRPTGDIDVVEVRPSDAKPWLARTAGAGSVLHNKHKLYLQIVTVASVPYSYEDRLTEIFPGHFERLRLFVLDPYDLALTKLTRNLDVDVEDVKHLVRSKHLDLGLLEARYRDELRPYVSGPVERHDLTLRLWLAAFREERGEGTDG